MNNNNSKNNLPFLGPITGRIRRESETVSFPDGQIYGKTVHETTSMDPSQTAITDKRQDQVPLACGCLPEKMSDIYQCRFCGRVVCQAIHRFRCTVCNFDGCFVCIRKVTIQESEAFLCEVCLQEASTPRIVRIVSKVIWG